MNGSGRDQKDDDDAERRRKRRFPVLWKGKLYQRGVVHDCLVKNFSATGAGITVEIQLEESDFRPGRGEIATLTILRFGDFPGQIAWQSGNKLGIAFMRDPADVEELTHEFLLHPDDRN